VSEVFRYEYLSRVGNVVVARTGATLFACCILCAAANSAHAASRPHQQTRDLGAIASVNDVPCDQPEQVSLAGPAGLLEVSATSAGGAVVGVASWYNPYVELDNTQTASGERYDRDKWTAAIQIDLRAAFGGVGYGRDYRAAYALVESGNKRMIVKINDVGPLRPGRVIDLSERAMRYLDQTLIRGLVPHVKLTLLRGGDWTPGPIVGDTVQTESCGLRDARRDDSPKKLSAVESSEPQAERQQRPDVRGPRDQHRAAAPSPRGRADDQMSEGRALRTSKNHLREANLTGQSMPDDNPVTVGALVRAQGDRPAGRVGAKVRYLASD
jgi:rare lipoprotein A